MLLLCHCVFPFSLLACCGRRRNTGQAPVRITVESQSDYKSIRLFAIEYSTRNILFKYCVCLSGFSIRSTVLSAACRPPVFH